MNTLIESEEILLNAGPDEVHSFLKDLRNHGLLMPEQVHGFEATEDTCRYEISGTGGLALKRISAEPGSIVMEPSGKAPFPYRFSWIVESREGGCKVKAVLEAEMNIIIRSVAMNPLKNFLEMQGRRLGEKFQ